MVFGPDVDLNVLFLGVRRVQRHGGWAGNAWGWNWKAEIGDQ